MEKSNTADQDMCDDGGLKEKALSPEEFEKSK